MFDSELPTQDRMRGGEAHRQNGRHLVSQVANQLTGGDKHEASILIHTVKEELGLTGRDQLTLSQITKYLNQKT